MDKLKQHIQSNRGELDIDQPKAEIWDRIKQEIKMTVDVDLLKNHLTQNAEDLDIEVPDSDTWNSIEHSINAKRTDRVVRIRKAIAYCAAACILVIIGIGALLSINKSINQDKERSIANIPSNMSTPSQVYTKPGTIHDETTEIPLQHNHRSKRTLVQSLVTEAAHKAVKEKQPSLPSQFLTIEHGYDELITSQVKYTQSLALYGESPSYFEGFINDFKALDQHEKQLRKLIMLDGMQDDRINDLAMIYQQKLTVLKKITDRNK